MEQLMRRRYIDANALQARLERKKAGISNQRYTEGWNDCMMRVKSMVSKAPTADVAPVVHGRWEWLGPNGLIADCMCGTCSACKVRSKYIVNTMLCPHCGAKMDGGR